MIEHLPNYVKWKSAESGRWRERNERSQVKGLAGCTPRDENWKYASATLGGPQEAWFPAPVPAPSTVDSARWREARDRVYAKCDEPFCANAGFNPPMQWTGAGIVFVYMWVCVGGSMVRSAIGEGGE